MVDEQKPAKKKDVSVRFPVAFLKEVVAMYPAATTVSEAIRMSVQHDMNCCCEECSERSSDESD